MPRFFVPDSQICDGYISVIGDDAHNISHSLRMRVGEKLTCCDENGNEYKCTVTDFSAETVTLKIDSESKCETEPPYKAVIYQSLVRGERFDTVIQKSVEYGAVAVVPVATDRATVKLSAQDAEKKRIRWKKIAEEAAKQCGRTVIPEVLPMVSFADAAECAEGLKLFCYENEKTVHLRDAFTGEMSGTVSVFIGPEGGYSEKEADIADACGMQTVSLGKRILRTESAAPFVLACLSYEWEK